VTSTTTRGAAAHDLDASISNSDALQGLIAAELPGDNGWHPANPAATDSLHPNGLPAFTDGVGALDGLTGLLNDFPALGSPTKLLQYDFAAPTTIHQINILTGNMNNADGRIFSTTVIRYSTNGGDAYELLGYFQSDPSGTINNENLGPADHASLVAIFDDAAAPLASAVTNLQLDFYAVDNTGGEMRDPFDGENPFTGIDDTLTAAFVAPLVWEIDVLAAAGGPNADFDADGDVDGDDFLAWQRGLGATGTATRAQGDADGDQDVDAVDLDAWRSQFGPGAGASAVPEPAAAGLVVACFAAAHVRRRLWMRARSLS
jgi:hypothetical protein